jgi:hypothetical protein
LELALESAPEAVWTTQSEIDYLDFIGAWHEPHIRNDSTFVKKLLGNYLQSIDRRSEWGDIEKEKVRAHAQMLLDECEEFSSV